MYDVIVVGARVAGSPTAMLLGRAGLRVLLVDRAEFPSDVLSTHLLHPRGGSYLNRWGLLDRLFARDTPSWEVHSAVHHGITLSGAPTRKMVSDRLVSAHGWTGDEALDAAVVRYCAPRRTVLDELLLEAAEDSGVHVRQGFTVEELIVRDEVVVGIRGRGRDGVRTTESARVVIGADGRNSLVAKQMRAGEYNGFERCTYCYYSYWEGVDTSGLTFPSLYVRGRIGAGAAPTNGGLVSVFTFGPREWFHDFRKDIEGNFDRALETIHPDLAERLRAGRRVEQFRGTADQPGLFRTPYGRGWALVGDAGCQKDQSTGSAMTHAFRDAEYLAEALVSGLDGDSSLEAALRGYAKKRDDDSRGYYEHVCAIAECREPTAESLQLLSAISRQQSDMDAYFGMQSDALPVREFYAPENIGRILRSSGKH